MDHIALLKNHFKSINTFEKSYDYIITLIKRGKKLFSPLKNWMVFICKILSSFTQRWFMSSLVEIGRVILWKKKLKIFLFHNYFPLEKGMDLHLNKRAKGLNSHLSIMSICISAAPLENPCLRGNEIYNFGRPFLCPHNCIVILFYAWEKRIRFQKK